MLEQDAFYINLGKSIRDYRKKEKISQETLANHLNLSRISIVNIEKGRQKVQIYTLYSIAKYLKVSIDNLMPEKSVDIINNQVIEKVNKAGGYISATEIVQSFVDKLL